MPWASSSIISESLQGVQKKSVNGGSIIRNNCFAPLVERYLEIAFAVFVCLFCFIYDLQRMTMKWVILSEVE